MPGEVDFPQNTVTSALTEKQRQKAAERIVHHFDALTPAERRSKITTKIEELRRTNDTAEESKIIDQAVGKVMGDKVKRSSPPVEVNEESQP